MSDTIVIAHNIRSIHNVGSIFRTCEGFGVTRLILSGYTPYPAYEGDMRLPHIAKKLTDQIHKTALGAEELIPFEHSPVPPINSLKQAGYTIVGLEQDDRAIMLNTYEPPRKVAIILGEEVNGIEQQILNHCDVLLEIPMQGQKESFNVSVATGIALYALTTTA